MLKPMNEASFEADFQTFEFSELVEFYKIEAPSSKCPSAFYPGASNVSPVKKWSEISPQTRCVSLRYEKSQVTPRLPIGEREPW